MKLIFDKYKGLKIKHKQYTGILCGYNNEHFILALEKPYFLAFRKLPKDSIIENPEYTSNKYKYMYENESELIKQFNETNNS